MSGPAGDRQVSANRRSHACPIVWRHDWNEWLFSFRTVRPAGLSFAPGQFVRLGLPGADGVPVWRAYSIASAPADPYLEFYSIVVPDGPFTQPLSRVRVGDDVAIDPIVYGFLRTDRFDGGRRLWLLATGTGVAPFRAIVADGSVRERFDDVIVVHSVRRPEELAYRDDFAAWTQSWTRSSPGRGTGSGARLHYVPTLTAAPAVDGGHAPGTLSTRITTLIGDGRLERALGLEITPADARVMVCGNPAMIREVRALLGARGMTPVRRETPGQFITENFW